MAQRRLSMRKTTEILRLKYEAGLTNRQIARSCGVTHTTVSNYLERVQEAGLGWPLPDEMDEERLQRLLFPEAFSGSQSSRPLPDMAYRNVSSVLRQQAPEIREEFPWPDSRFLAC